MVADLKRRVASLRHSPGALSRLRFHVLVVNIWLDEDRPDDDDNTGILIPSEIGLVEFTVKVCTHTSAVSALYSNG